MCIFRCTAVSVIVQEVNVSGPMLKTLGVPVTTIAMAPDTASFDVLEQRVNAALERVRYWLAPTIIVKTEAVSSDCVISVNSHCLRRVSEPTEDMAKLADEETAMLRRGAPLTLIELKRTPWRISEPLRLSMSEEVRVTTLLLPEIDDEVNSMQAIVSVAEFWTVKRETLLSIPFSSLAVTALTSFTGRVAGTVSFCVDASMAVPENVSDDVIVSGEASAA